ncbi:MAG: LysR substrate-binding domain-containing protein [Paraburkholderia sp.]|jgi:DNA-binding transcriptional LysR family regulator|uniref:LysR substrate-binding domain-containing protein n=2 Tax=Burkholderiales TaxID=80840 RepID=UPI0010F61A43|nr:LysR substrate-binding domain-containing protein [Burkholderia sp. 4M9327F10]
MKIRQLEAFNAVMVCRTVTRAAQMLHVSQPAVTRLISDLEESTGFVLFDRAHGRLQPTPEAFALHEEVQRSLVGVERIERAALEIRASQRGTLQIAGAPALALSFLPRAIAEFSRLHTGVEISLAAHPSHVVLDMVIEHRCDVGFVILALSTPAAHGELLMSTRMVCALPATHRLTAKATLVPEDLRNEPFVSHWRGLQARYEIDALFASHGIERKLIVETQTAVAICSFVSAGMGVAIIDPVTALEYRGTDIVFRRFRPDIVTDFSVLLPSQRPPSLLVKKFVTHVRAFAHAQLPQDALI